jgi:diacylglycerol kinase family enzyme
LREAAAGAEVLAVGGGDGTVAAAAGVAIDAGLPLAVFPAGTFNHFAKDIGCDTVAKTVDAIRRGSVARVDVVCLNGSQMVLNTASIGAYPAFVRRREKLEKRIGKPLAGLYAMLRTLRTDEPIRISYDNKTLLTSLFFLGNSVYMPTGFAPSRRTRMDDGLVDVRILEAGRRWARTRILTALVLGRLERSPGVAVRHLDADDQGHGSAPCTSARSVARAPWRRSESSAHRYGSTNRDWSTRSPNTDRFCRNARGWSRCERASGTSVSARRSTTSIGWPLSSTPSA